MSGRWTLFVWKGKTGSDDASFVFRRGRSLDEKCLQRRTASVLQIEWIVPPRRERFTVLITGRNPKRVLFQTITNKLTQASYSTTQVKSPYILPQTTYTGGL